MSTQEKTGTVFSILPEEQHQHFRLLELPPELLSLLTSDEPPILHLKATEGPAGQPLESNAVLCTPDKTFNLCQVSTSNSLFVTESREHPPTKGSEIPQLKVQAIAKSVSTLEVSTTTGILAEPYIKAALPVYTSTGHAGSKTTLSKHQLFSNIPLSESEIEKVWTQLACFELSDPRRCFIPSPATRWRVWQSMKTVADAEGLDLTQRLTDVDQKVMVQEVDDAPAELSSAVLRSVSATWTESGFQLDGEACARFVGTSLLRERTEREATIATGRFAEAWKEKLPHQWEKLAEVGLLSPHCRMQNSGNRIAFVEADSNAANGEATGAKSTLGAKRKWHEKFRASKKTS